jgi:hypothetical protein
MKVLKIDDAQIRKQIEDFSDNDDNTHFIRFTQDGAGVWFITERVVNDPLYKSIKDLMLSSGEWVEYTPPLPED